MYGLEEIVEKIAVEIEVADKTEVTVTEILMCFMGVVLWRTQK